MPDPSCKAGGRKRLAVVLKGYPRLSETFIAQEILALEQLGFEIDIWSLRRPTDKYTHPMHRQIKARLFYLPEYLHDAPLRVLKGLFWAIRQPGFIGMFKAFGQDLLRDRTVNRIRRFGQACVLGAEIDPAIQHLHVHFLHTPGSVVRYACSLTNRRFSFSAHAKDIWTTPDWEKREKIGEAQWGVTCTRDGLGELRRAAGPELEEKVHLIYHGLDLERFPKPSMRDDRQGAVQASAPVRILTIGRAVQKKGFDDLIQALAILPQDLSWRLTMIGSGPLLPELKRQAEIAGIEKQITWTGALPQDKVIAHLQGAELFVLPSKPGSDGDRDGLPNVLMEAASQGLPLISTRFAAVPEFVEHGREGLLVSPGDAQALAAAIETLIRSPQMRQSFGDAARQKVETGFSFDAGIGQLAALLRQTMERAQVGP